MAIRLQRQQTAAHPIRTPEETEIAVVDLAVEVLGEPHVGVESSGFLEQDAMLPFASILISRCWELVSRFSFSEPANLSSPEEYG